MVGSMDKPAKTFKAILIDPVARTVAVVDTNGSLEHWYQLVKTEYLEHKTVSTGEIMIFAEKQKPSAGIFRIAEFVVCGRALIVGSKSSGETRDTRLSVDALRALIHFAETP